MKSSQKRKKIGGFAMIALMACLVVILIVFSGVMYWITSNGKQMRKNEIYTTSEAAAEGATEMIFAHMDRDYLYSSLNAASNAYTGFLPSTNGWPVQYTYSVTVSLGSTNNSSLQYLGSEYTNLLGLPVTNTITVTATPTGQMYNIPSTVSQTYIFATIPAFQFAIFYNMNMEVDPSATMPIQGAVFSNGGIWTGTYNVTYSKTVEAAGQVYTNAADPFCAGKVDNNDSGTPQSSFLYTGSPPQPESNMNPLVIPIGASSTGTNDNSTNVQAIVEIPPSFVAAPQSIAYEPTNQVYDFNAASMIVSNWSWSTNGCTPWTNHFTLYAQDTLLAPNFFQNNGRVTNWVQLTNDYYIISNRWLATTNFYTTNWIPASVFQFTNNWISLTWTNTPAQSQTNQDVGTNYVWYAGFSFLTNASFYDYREQATVQAVQIDVGKLSTWITNNGINGGSNWNQELCEDVDHGFNSIYVDNTVPLSGQHVLPAVRVVHGTLLPNSTCTVSGLPVTTSGLSVATAQPIYVEGNYNTQIAGSTGSSATNHGALYTYPAAFLADSITVLSTNWSDGYNSGTTLSSRTPVVTTINAACLEGIVPSVNTSAVTNYSGGVENFLRLEENWSGIAVWYTGSIMVMYPSQYATNLWPGTGSVYNPPTRDWAFDTNYLNASLLPPLTPNFKAVIRNSWTGY